jgi:hypothetical protein
MRFRCRTAATCALILVSGLPVEAQRSNSTSRPDVDVTIGALASIQPMGYDRAWNPYLDNSLGGLVPGFSAALGFSCAAGPCLTVEVTSTTALEALQSGRFIRGGGPVLARHRDTLLSILPGFHFRLGGGSVEAKAGLSLLFGTPQREGRQYDDRAGTLAFTTGLDAVAPLGKRMAVVPAFRYSYASRSRCAVLWAGQSHCEGRSRGPVSHRALSDLRRATGDIGIKVNREHG